MTALTRLFLGSSASSGASSGLNLLATVLVVRWFGAETYAHYIVDLAMLSILMIFLEVVPSNYSVFRIQDDPDWQRSVAAQIAVTMILAAGVVSVLGKFTSMFQAYTVWMPLYAATLAIKRYLDLRLQASGRLPEFLNIEVTTSVIRLVLLAFYMSVREQPTAAVWASLAVATLLSQTIWWVLNPTEFRAFFGFIDRLAWVGLVKSSPAYVPYYAGVVLKRLKDNIVPIVADRLFPSREVLATFFLAYRGVVFAVGQVRILEALMNHRATLRVAAGLTRKQYLLVAAAAQAICLLASAGLMLSSGLAHLPWLTAFALSFMVWPIVHLTLERARAYSSFQAMRVNASIFGYLSILLGLSYLLQTSKNASVTAFALILVAAEAFGLFVIRNHGRERHAEVR